MAAKWSARAAFTAGVSAGTTAPFGCPTKTATLAGTTSANPTVAGPSPSGPVYQLAGPNGTPAREAEAAAMHADAIPYRVNNDIQIIVSVNI